LGRGLAVIDDIHLTVVVNVGDDLPTHGLYVAPDIDTVIYTLAGVEGEQGWGRAGDTFVANTELARFGVDNRFRLGDLDLALKIHRTERLAAGDTLSAITDAIRKDFGIRASITPATDDILRTMVTITTGETLTFQAYFVERGHRDRVVRIEFAGSAQASPAPGVLASIEAADLVVVGPSNPPLSIWPILAVPGMAEAIRSHPRVVAVSPLVGGATLKGPADTVMADLGLGSGTSAVLAAYRGLINTLVVHTGDRREAEVQGVSVIEMDTLIPDLESSARLARAILAL
jgi:LPPG:FO 2-phospho-L-lactate transferase